MNLYLGDWVAPSSMNRRRNKNMVPVFTRLSGASGPLEQQGTVESSCHCHNTRSFHKKSSLRISFHMGREKRDRQEILTWDSLMSPFVTLIWVLLNHPSFTPSRTLHWVGSGWALGSAWQKHSQKHNAIVLWNNTGRIMSEREIQMNAWRFEGKMCICVQDNTFSTLLNQGLLSCSLRCGEITCCGIWRTRGLTSALPSTAERVVNVQRPNSALPDSWWRLRLVEWSPSREARRLFLPKSRNCVHYWRLSVIHVLRNRIIQQ